jgi:site-specific recombinase XerD
MIGYDFPEYLTAFFTQYLVLQRGLSPNTVASYSDAFFLLFKYLNEKHRLKPDRITFAHITRERVVGFCQWLEASRNASVKTINLRLTAIHSFFRYVGMREPSRISLCKNILDIQMKKCEKKVPMHLSDDEVKMLLAEPDFRKKQGIRDLAIITVLYDSGVRVSELISLKLSDIRLGGTATVRIIGKGRKQRLVPISLAAANIIKAYYKAHQLDPNDSERNLFVNSREEPLTRPGINYILDKYVQQARQNNPDHFNVNVTAHVMRHSKAVSLLLSEVSLIYIRDFLGHSSVVTTEHYARTNPEFLRKAIESNAQDYTDDTVQYSQEEQEHLIDFLKSFRK